jgi:hypothetical protein
MKSSSILSIGGNQLSVYYIDNIEANMMCCCSEDGFVERSYVYEQIKFYFDMQIIVIFGKHAQRDGDNLCKCYPFRSSDYISLSDLIFLLRKNFSRFVKDIETQKKFHDLINLLFMKSSKRRHSLDFQRVSLLLLMVTTPVWGYLLEAGIGYMKL